MTPAVTGLAGVEVRETVRQIVGLVKGVDASQIGDDALLFAEAGAMPDIQLDSLDTLDLALQLKERFDPGGNQLEPLLNGEVDPKALSTVAKISEYIVSVLPATTGELSALSGNQSISDSPKGVPA